MRFSPIGALVLGSALAAGCTRPVPAVVAVKPPEVIFDYPSEAKVADYEEFTGRITALNIVEVRARVTGHLEAQLFKDGEEVQKDAPLFLIDAKPFNAELERAKAAVKQAEAKVKRLTRDDTRAQELLPRRAISQEEADRIAGELDEARAAVDVTKAQQKLAQQNVDYTRILSPIKGRISKRSMDPGNLVKADDTLLTTIVFTDKVYADFDVDDRTDLLIGRRTNAGDIASIRAGNTKVLIGLPDKDGFPLKGKLIFVDNKLNPGTGTIGMRAEVDNENHLLEPGLFVRVRLPIGEPKNSILVPEAAIGTDQGLKYVFVLDADNNVQYRRVNVGMQIERMRIKKEGESEAVREQFRVVEAVPEVKDIGVLTGERPVQYVKDTGVLPTDRIIVEGLQRVRAGAKVSPKPRAPSKYHPLPSEMTPRESAPVDTPVSKPGQTANTGSQ